ncbi:hypothetical protein PVAP13_5KG600107 [Panicum virgatum]|uniref:Uncharacterized protein n=1 Tax=Panicum virgatum TaxID=38727 RepID=A0A8T0SPV8_PANVG|nr:hypothetical protein PVAP13_5KG600107 [Panicum virgatum]
MWWWAHMSVLPPSYSPPPLRRRHATLRRASLRSHDASLRCRRASLCHCPSLRQCLPPPQTEIGRCDSVGMRHDRRRESRLGQSQSGRSSAWRWRPRSGHGRRAAWRSCSGRALMAAQLDGRAQRQRWRSSARLGGRARHEGGGKRGEGTEAAVEGGATEEGRRRRLTRAGERDD